jgi:hypothetical protein
MYELTAEEKAEQMKWRAKQAADSILMAEQLKADKELMKHVKTEMKERAKVLESAIGKKKAAPAPTKKSTPKKRK